MALLVQGGYLQSGYLKGGDAQGDPCRPKKSLQGLNISKPILQGKRNPITFEATQQLPGRGEW
jgi:hypothetical protein